MYINEVENIQNGFIMKIKQKMERAESVNIEEEINNFALDLRNQISTMDPTIDDELLDAEVEKFKLEMSEEFIGKDLINKLQTEINEGIAFYAKVLDIISTESKTIPEFIRKAKEAVKNLTESETEGQKKNGLVQEVSKIFDFPIKSYEFGLTFEPYLEFANNLPPKKILSSFVEDEEKRCIKGLMKLMKKEPRIQYLIPNFVMLFTMIFKDKYSFKVYRLAQFCLIKFYKKHFNSNKLNYKAALSIMLRNLYFLAHVFKEVILPEDDVDEILKSDKIFLTKKEETEIKQTTNEEVKEISINGDNKEETITEEIEVKGFTEDDLVYFNLYESTIKLLDFFKNFLEENKEFIKEKKEEKAS